jgi:NADH-quinone oxidoreductase subunit L
MVIVERGAVLLDYLWIIPVLPLLGVVLNLFLGYRLGRRFVNIVGPGVVGLAFVASLLAVVQLLGLPAEERSKDLALFSWIPVGDFQVSAALLLDPLSAVMILVVTGVGFVIHVYSAGYMADDTSYARYFTYLNLFTFSMLTLVLASNYLLLYVGWELVGICSYLLIGFWFARKSAADAGKKAFIVNRIGDFGFALGIMLIFITFKTLDYKAIFGQAEHILQGASIDLGAGLVVGTATLITLLLFIGATGKSAQIPLFVWLPDAMEGPTPVSALIHAATMVTAGVYMVARSSALFDLAPSTMMLVAVVGVLTAMFAASMALVQHDLKRVLAYSTISQLGFMFLALGVGAFAAGIFHLMTHAFFKALLFLGAGSVMHAMHGQTDMRRMGGLRAKMPITFWTFMLGALAISGIPGFSGFFSKDDILLNAFAGPHGNPILWLLALITAGMTVIYIWRAIFLTFTGAPRSSEAGHGHESPPVMYWSLITLAVLAVIGGYAGIPSFLGGNNAIGSFLEPVFQEPPLHVEAATEWGLMLAAVAMALVALAVTYYVYIKRADLPHKIAERFGSGYTLVYNKYYIDELYVAAIVNPLKALAGWLARVLDVQVIDGIANGLASLVAWCGQKLRAVQNGYVRSYALAILVGAVALLGYLLVR